MKVYYMNKHVGVAVAECYFSGFRVVPDCYLVKVPKEICWLSWQGKNEPDIPEEFKAEERLTYMPYVWGKEHSPWRYEYINSYEVE